MEKIWFIFEKDHHLGPFSTEDIEELYKNGHIGADAQLWKESVSDWISLKNLVEFSFLFPKEEAPSLPEVEVPADIPGIPPAPELPVQDNIEHEEEAEVPPVQVEEVLPPVDLPVVPEIPVPVQKKVEKKAKKTPAIPKMPEAPAIPTPPKIEKTPKVEIAPVVKPSPEIKKAPLQEKPPAIETPPVEIPEVKVVQTPELPEVSEFEESTGEFDVSAQISSSQKISSEAFEEELADEVAQEYDASDEIEDDVEYDDDDKTGEIEVDDSFYTQPKKSFSWLKVPAIAVFSLVILLTVYITLNTHTEDNRFERLSDENFHALMALTKKAKTKRVRMKMALTRDASELWLASNYKDKAILNLTLKSFKGRVLSNDKVRVKGKAFLRNGAAYFDKLELVEGEKLVAGQYMAQVIGVPDGLSAQVANWLKEVGLGDTLSFVKERNKKIQFRGSVLLFGGSSSDFEIKLANFKKGKLENLISPFRERLESYKTLKAMVSNIEETYMERLKSIRRGKHIKDFEADFATQISPMLQEIIIGIYKKHQSFIGKDAKAAKAYEDLLAYGKSVGELGSDMITQTGSSVKVMKKDRNRLRRIFTKRSLDLRNQAEEQLQSHYDRILYLRSRP